jgi:hypothetical protein
MIGSEIRATWSPDGSQITYVQTTPDGGNAIYVINADGTDPHSVFECEDWCNTTDYLDWAVDGGIYVGIDSDVPADGGPPLTFEIWQIDPSTGDAQAVLTRHADGLTVEQPRVSPDGSQLVYVRVRLSDEKWAIFVSDMAGGEERQLTDWDLYASYPDWSANDMISFNTNDFRLRHNESHEIYTVAPDGTGLHKIETPDFDSPSLKADSGHARWTPDGSAITYSVLIGGEPYLALMDADGTNQRLVPGRINGSFSEMRLDTRPINVGCSPEEPCTLAAGDWTLVGKYSFLPGLRLTMPDGWQSQEQDAGEFNLWPDDHPNDHILMVKDIAAVTTDGTMQVVSDVPQTIEGLTTYWQNEPNLLVSEPSQVTIANGIAATTYVVTVSPAAAFTDRGCPAYPQCADLFTDPIFWGGGVYGIGAPAAVRLYLAEIGTGNEAHVFVVGLEAESESALQRLTSDAAPILNSIRLPEHIVTW